MVYLPNIPNATDIPSQSQSQIQQNFTQLNTQFSSEHVAFNAGASNGQHKAITLPVNPTVPAPAGRNWQLIHSSTGVFPAVKETLDIKYAGPAFLAVPLRHLISPIAVPAGPGTFNLIDFATVPNLGTNASGTVFIYDASAGHQNRTVWSTFVWITPTIYMPAGPAQLKSGGKLTGFTSAGTVLQVTADATWGGGNVTLVLTESRTL